MARNDSSLDPNKFEQVLDKEMEEIRQMDLDDVLQKDTPLAEKTQPEPIKEADEKLESISNRVDDQSVYTKFTNRTQISKLKRQLEQEKEFRLKIESEMNELRQTNQEIVSQLQSIQKGQN